MQEIIIKAWSAAQKRYVSIWGARESGTCLIFDRVTETVAFRAKPRRDSLGVDALTASKQCDRFIDEKCAEAVIAALREAGYLPT